MFTGYPDTLLGVDRTGVGRGAHPQEDILKLIHAGVDEQ